MSKSTDISLRQVTSDTEQIKFRVPIKFGGRVMDEAELLNVTVEVETRDGRRGRGFGSMPMGNVWAWPSQPGPRRARRCAAMIAAGPAAGRARPTEYRGSRPSAGDHPRAGAGATRPRPTRITQAAGLAEPMPRLAQLVAASPLEAAIHDAYGKALGQNSYNLLGPEFVNRDLAAYLGAEFAGEYLDRYTLPQPKPRDAALSPGRRPGSADRRRLAGPASATACRRRLPEWIASNGLTHLKIKLNGDDLAWDVERVASVERVAAEAQAARGCTTWCYSADFNEKCANVDYVLDFLAQVGERSPAALRRLQYIEQPTHRDLRANPENRMHRAAKIKPVVIDESLVDLESLLLSRELGYSGVALKACKGHSEALLMGAAAQKYGMFLCVQDLTCPGASFLHSASLAARIPAVAAIEGNGRQYCPAGNRGWAERFPTMFHITDGTVGTAALDGPGLGF